MQRRIAIATEAWTPGGDWQDRTSGCQKQGGELVCPSGSGTAGGSFGGIPKQLMDLKIECPKQL